MRSRLTALFILVLVAVPASAQPRTHDVTIDDYFTLATVTQFAVAPDGEHVAYCDARWHQSTDDRKAERLLAQIPVAIADHYWLSRGGNPLAARQDLSHAANFLYMLRGTDPNYANVYQGLLIIFVVIIGGLLTRKTRA